LALVVGRAAAEQPVAVRAFDDGRLERRETPFVDGVDRREDAEMLSAQTRKGEGRENVKSVLLGRGASDDKVDHWLREAAPVEGFIGFAIGRSIWWDALKGFLGGDLEREAAAQRIADNYLRFIKVYEEAEASVKA
jgi:tagatose-1,6-bisphosphate aldolase